jgi:galactose mutarotase-like enzyme
MRPSSFWRTSVTSSEENVVIAAGGCSVTLLPALGGKIATITANGHQLLQPPLAPYAPRTRETPFLADFDQSDASGWDECLPSVAACTLPTASGPAAIPDHGDLWRIPWQLLDHTQASATLRAQCFSLPLELTRSIAIHEIPTGWRLDLQYTLVNRGPHPTPWSWAAHSLFHVEPGDTLHLPVEIHFLRIEGSRNNRLGLPGGYASWPIAELPATPRQDTHQNPTLADPNLVDLRLVQPPTAATGDKLFAGPITNPSSAWCVLERPSVNLRLTIRFNPALTPYLGLWICYGGWPERPGPKQVCIAPEPATAPVDSLAAEGPWARHLQPGESTTWPVHLEIENLSRPTSTKPPS